jgi:hypothetical protein
MEKLSYGGIDVSERQRRELFDPSAKQGIDADHQRVGFHLCNAQERWFEIGIGARM